MSEGSQTDPKARIAELEKRRDDIDAEVARIRAGDIPLLDDTALKDRFQQFLQLARSRGHSLRDCGNGKGRYQQFRMIFPEWLAALSSGRNG